MNFFKLKENKTTVSQEILAGVTTFMTMAYILAVNPGIMEAAGMDKGAVFTVTALSSFVGTAMMAILANYPFALAPGMGLNAFFAYTVAAQYGWELALIAVFTEGIIFMLMSLISVREAIFRAIPANMKYAVSVGIGLFICLIGLKNGGLVVGSDATLVSLGKVSSITTLLFLIGCILTIVLSVKRVRGAIFIGIFATYFLGLICQLAGLYVPNPEIGMYSLIPSGVIALPPGFGSIMLPTAFKSVNFGAVGIFNFIAIMFAFLFVDIFDTIGTLIGVSEKAGFLNEKHELPKLKEALLSDAIGTTFGAFIGASTVTTYVESAAGVAEGGRTGLTALTTAFLFLVSLLFWPLFSVIPAFATAPALVVVGLFMTEAVTKINFSDFDEGFPAFMTIVMMPFAYSISDGIVFGSISYVLVKLLTGKRKDITVVMYVLALLFLAKLIFT